MFRLFLLSTAICLIPAAAFSQDAPQFKPPELGPPGAPSLDLTNAKAVLNYIETNVELVLQDRDPASSLVRQQELVRLLARLPTDNEAQRNTVALATKQIQVGHEKVYIQVTPLPTLIEKLRSNPNDLYAVHYLHQKLYVEIAPPLFITDPDAAAKKLDAVKAVLAEIEQKATADLTKKHLASAQKTVVRLEKNIALSKDARHKQQALIGQQAPPLVVETWLNGTPQSADDLKGKTVLLGFFSSISMRAGEAEGENWPKHLKQLAEWQTKYAERGLVVLSVARYSNMRWDDMQQAPVLVRRNMEVVPAAEEQATLTKLARAQGWTQRLAIQQRDENTKALRHYPALSHPTVLIDRQGKIRMIRGGAFEQFTRDISNELESLLGSADRR
jgi:hypothetical protein